MGTIGSFEMFDKYLDLLVKSTKYLLIVKSKGGLAKTSKTIGYLNKNKIEYSLVSGHVTPLHFFDIIKGAGEKIVVLDDVEALIKNKDIMGLIKQACCETINDKRLVQYNSSKREIEDTAFICKAKFIMLCNKTPMNADFKAILSRSYFFNLRPSNSEIITAIKKFDKKLDAELINFLINTCGEHTPLDFRVYQNLKEIKRLNKECWKELATDNLNISERDKYIEHLVFSGIPIKDQIIQYEKDTGNKKRQYYDDKKKVLKVVK